MATKLLPCILTPAELAAKGDELSQKTTELDALRKEKAEINATITGKIKAVERDTLRIAQQMARKSEDREVIVEDIPDYSNKIMETFRRDTDERIAYRLLTQEELQGKLHMVTPLRREGTTGVQAEAMVAAASEVEKKQTDEDHDGHPTQN